MDRGNFFFRSIHFFAPILIMLALLGCSNEPVGKPIERTFQESLEFLVGKSDLIAIVEITRGEDDIKIPSLSEPPKLVDGRIIRLIKGHEASINITIQNQPEHLRPNVILSSMAIRTGRHLAFLNGEEGQYKPTTSLSLSEINLNKVHPIWRLYIYTETGPRGLKFSKGIELDRVIDEINIEMNRI